MRPNYALNDEFFRSRVEQVIAERGISVVVETGIDEGLSAVKFCGMVPHYVGIDIDRVCIEKTVRVLRESGANNFELICGDSPKVLSGELMSSLPDTTLFFIDAHCYQDTPCPVADEIRAIPPGKGILVFHDIAVPGREYGGFYTVIDGESCLFSYDVIRDALTAWSQMHRVEYMTECAHEKSPGVMFVYPR